MDFITAMNTYLQEQEKSRLDKLAEQRAFSALVLVNLKASVQRVENDIAQYDNEIIALTDQDEKKQGISKFNRSAVIDLAEVMPIKSLLSLATKLEDDKKQLERNLNSLKKGQEFQVSRVNMRIAEYTERIGIYREVYQNRVQYPVVDTEWA
jgi:cell division protein FtsB